MPIASPFLYLLISFGNVRANLLVMPDKAVLKRQNSCQSSAVEDKLDIEGLTEPVLELSVLDCS